MQNEQHDEVTIEMVRGDELTEEQLAAASGGRHHHHRHSHSHRHHHHHHRHAYWDSYYW